MTDKNKYNNENKRKRIILNLPLRRYTKSDTERVCREYNKYMERKKLLEENQSWKKD